ncbi:MAG: EpsG family protein [Paludibacteraceae bacterium]|nr:EpsG family protein [Paludibacteraceae bacterium]
MGYSGPSLAVYALLGGIAVLQFLFSRYALLQRLLVFSVFALLLVFIGFRGFVETDMHWYYPLFEEIPVFGDGILPYAFQVGVEPGFLLWTSLLKTLCPSYVFYTAVNTLVDLLLLTVVFNRYFPRRYYALFMLLFLAFFGLTYEFNLLRNVKSMLLFLLSLKYVPEGRLGRYLAFNTVGLLFHWSAVLYMVLYGLLRRDFVQRRYWIVLGISLVMYLLSPFIVKYLVWAVSLLHGTLGQRASIYLSEGEYARQKLFSLGDLDRMLMAVLIGWRFNRIKQSFRESNLFLHLYALYIFFAFCGHGMEILHTRVANLFVAGVWVLYVSLMQVEKRLPALALFFYFNLASLFKVWSQSDKNRFMQYDNYLLDEKVITFEERENYYYSVYSKIPK